MKTDKERLDALEAAIKRVAEVAKEMVENRPEWGPVATAFESLVKQIEGGD